MVDVNVECVSSLSVCTLLQTQLFQAGIIWQLMPHLFRYDYTLDEGGVAHSEKTNQQAVLNRLARNCCEALACLAGFRHPDTPENDGVQNSLRAMLTPFMCRQMQLASTLVPVNPPQEEEGIQEIHVKGPPTESDGALVKAERVASPPNPIDEEEDGTELEAKPAIQYRNDYVLKLLNSNTENPYLIWDNSTRAELQNFIDKQRNSNENLSELFGAEFKLSVYAAELIVGEIFVRIYNVQPEFKLLEPKQTCVDLLDYLVKQKKPLLCQEGIVQSALKPKPVPGPKPLNLIAKPAGSALNGTTAKSNAATKSAQKGEADLIDLTTEFVVEEELPALDWGQFVTAAPDGAAVQPRDGSRVDASGNQLPLERIRMVLEALRNVLMMNPGIERLLIGHFETIFGFLRVHSLSAVQLKALQIVSIAASNKECVSDIACKIQLPLLLTLLSKLPKAVEIILRTLIALVANGTVVKDLLEYGGLVYILSIFTECSANSHEVTPGYSTASRMLSAELLAKLQTDKLTGPKWTRFLIRFLPSTFADVLRDNPGQAIQIFDSTTENPELIWNDGMRSEVRQILKRILAELVNSQQRDPNARWNPNTIIGGSQCAYEGVVCSEVIIGGVFLRLFIANPSWAVRHPRQFATELVERLLELWQPQKTNRGEEELQKWRSLLEQVTKSLVLLSAHHPTTMDMIPVQGYLPQFCQSMQMAPNNDVARSALQILNQLSENTNCANTFTSIPALVKGMLVCMRQQPELSRESAHAVKMFAQRCTPEFAEQMLLAGMVEHLLKMLASPLPGVSNPAAAKAEIADALKCFCKDAQFGERISQVLQKSQVWAQYRDQRHDLFLPTITQTQAITGAYSETPKQM